MNIHHLLFMGAYRDDQVGAAHPLMQMVTEMEHKTLAIHMVRLENLAYDAVSLLLSDRPQARLVSNGSKQCRRCQLKRAKKCRLRS